MPARSSATLCSAWLCYGSCPRLLYNTQPRPAPAARPGTDPGPRTGSATPAPAPAIYGPSGDVRWDEADPTLLPGGSQARGLIAPLPESSKTPLDFSRYLHIQ